MKLKRDKLLPKSTRKLRSSVHKTSTEILENPDPFSVIDRIKEEELPTNSTKELNQNESTTSSSELSSLDEFEEDIKLNSPKIEKKPRTWPKSKKNDIFANDEEFLALTPQMKRKVRMDHKISISHPQLAGAWDSLVVELKGEAQNQPEHLLLKLLPFQKEGLTWLLKQEQECNGGLLADEMGMGKTISMISLLLTSRKKPVLIIAPAVAVMQWKSEIQTHVSPVAAFSVLIFHGQNRINDAIHLAQYDIIITTYSLVESAYRRQRYGFQRGGEKVHEESALHSVPWERVVLDEAHYIKDRSTNTARAVYALKSKFKWSLTGTPIQNRVGEFYSVIRFLELDPFGYYFCKDCKCRQLNWQFTGGRACDHCGHKPMRHFCYWNREILKPIQNFGSTGDGGIAFRKLSLLLDRYMLRRTKLEKAEDLGLPPRHVFLRRDHFNEEESDFYNSLFSDTKRKFATYVAEGTVLNNYANIFELITKMRQASNHPEMVVSKMQPDKHELVCGICHYSAEDPVTSKCKHVFCREDIRQYLESCDSDVSKTCPVCFTKLVVDLDGLEIIPEKPYTSILNKIDIDEWKSSTKIEALVEELFRLKNENYTIKSIVFSQFVSFLDLIHWRLKRAGFECVKLDGRMNMVQRDAVIGAFMKNPNVTIFLISLKAGGVALNLTEASQIFIMDPWWNPAAEDQAMDRIHRLGQYRPIRIMRLIIEDSIEERIIQLQEKKKALFDSTVGRDISTLSRLAPDDLLFLFSH